VTTLNDLVEEVVGELVQFTTNQERTGTFTGWQLDDGLVKIGVNLADLSSDLRNARVELASGEIVHVGSFSSANGTSTCPPWFRGQMGSPQNDDVEENTRVIVNPQWPRYQVARKIVEGINAINEDLFAVDEVELTTQPVPSNYELPADLDGILEVEIVHIGPAKRHQPLKQWSLDSKNPDGLKFLRVEPLRRAGRPLRVTYRKVPVTLDPGDLSADWSLTGLPVSAADLPVLYAKSQLILAADASKAQQQTVEQGERQRTLQGWSPTATSRRWQELFSARLADERRKLRDRYPVRPHKELV
jgi:hypothetical protein